MKEQIFGGGLQQPYLYLLLLLLYQIKMGSLKPKKQRKKLARRQEAYNRLMSHIGANNTPGFTKPGSMNSHKS